MRCALKMKSVWILTIIFKRRPARTFTTSYLYLLKHIQNHWLKISKWPLKHFFFSPCIFFIKIHVYESTLANSYKLPQSIRIPPNSRPMSIKIDPTTKLRMKCFKKGPLKIVLFYISINASEIKILAYSFSMLSLSLALLPLAISCSAYRVQKISCLNIWMICYKWI